MTTFTEPRTLGDSDSSSVRHGSTTLPPRATETLPALLRRRAATHPERLFVWCGDDRLTYREADARADRVASGFRHIGVEPGERVAIITPNRIEMLEMFLGLARLGAVQVPLNAYLKGQFLQYQLADSQATALVCDAAGWRAAEPLLGDLPQLRTVIHLDPPPGGLDAAGRSTVTYGEVTDVDPVELAEPGLDDLLSIVYTSGTTGLPKGCMLPHGYYARVSLRGVEWQGLTSDDVYMTALPLFHAAARMSVVGASLTAGATAVVEPAFSPSRVLQRARETGATILGGVGAMGVAFLSQPPAPDDREHDLRTIWFVPFTPEQQAETAERFGVALQCELYGQTECFPLTFNPSDGPRNHASDGLPAGDLEVKLIDDDGDEVPAGQPGEIVVRPRVRHSMFAGYWGKPEATLEAFRDLWYHTGDFGRADEQGFIRFVDRKKDTLRRRGENVSSVELEGAILQHPAVAEVAVHAVPSEVSEDEIKACIVLAAGHDPDPDVLFQHFKTSLPYYAVPRYVEFLESLPRNAVGRVMKHELRAAGLTAATVDLERLGLTISREERR